MKRDNTGRHPARPRAIPEPGWRLGHHVGP